MFYAAATDAAALRRAGAALALLRAECAALQAAVVETVAWYGEDVEGWEAREELEADDGAVGGETGEGEGWGALRPVAGAEEAAQAAADALPTALFGAVCSFAAEWRDAVRNLR